MKIEKNIIESVKKITEGIYYKNWFSELKSIEEDDLIMFNNSFIFRDNSNTVKSSKYLGFSLTKKRTIKNYYVIQGVSINSDFKHIKSKEKAYTKIFLGDEIIREKKDLGVLLFVLVGIIDENIKLEIDLTTPIIKKIIFNPITEALEVKDDVLYLNDTSDEDLIWDIIKLHYQGNDLFVKNEILLKEEIGRLIDKIEKESYSLLKIPETINNNDLTVIKSLIIMLDVQIEDYKLALLKCSGDSVKDKNYFNELLKISYNFSSDALTFIRLIVNVCDLKPIVLWGTINEQYTLSESFKNLPWIRSKRKASLENYKSIIGGSRNSAFHNFFPFKRSIDIIIPDKSLKEIKLRTFSEFTKKTQNSLKFTDKELIDVLMEFTRTNYHKITPLFWQKNLDVLIATKLLFTSTSDFLESLLKEK